MHTDRLLGGATRRIRFPCLRHPTFKSKKRSPEGPSPLVDSCSEEDEDVNMGKSNKFDYTNRPNSGAKLGYIVGTALQKEAEKVKKDADRGAQKARKQSTDSSGGFAEPGTMTHIIDLKAPSKDLGDDGVSALADGLEIALRSASSTTSLALEDLNLCGNGITTVSLARLAPIIELAKYDLKTLNLSSNKIEVKTDEQAAQWEAFLRAFKICMKLRRLDLSSNVELGARALEVLARVHIAEDQINVLPPGGYQSTYSLESERGAEDVTSMTRRATDAHFSPTMTGGQLLIKRRCGLRSIPYVTLQNVGLDDAGAMWLSYVIEDHHYPNQLIDELNATLASSSITTYQQEANFRGMDYDYNKTLGKEGKQLLEKTEGVRRHAMLDDGSTLASSLAGDVDSVLREEDQGRRKSTERKDSRAMQGERRASMRSIHTADGDQHEATELERARKKIQRYIIAHDGPSSVELWRSALKVFRVSRVLLYISPTGRKYSTDILKTRHANVPCSPTVVPPTPADSPTTTDNKKLSIDTTKAANLSPTDRVASYASKLAGLVSSQENVLTEVTNTPESPQQHQKPTHRKGAFSEGADLQTVTDKLNVLAVRSSDPLRFIKYQQDLITEAATEGRQFTNKSMPSHLPMEVVDYILTFLMTERELNVMSAAQRSAAVEWGQRRGTLMAEREWLRKDGSAQVLMLLDSINCLAYGH